MMSLKAISWPPGEEAREVFARVGARPWLERTDDVLSGKVPPIPAPSSLAEEAPIS